MQQGFPKRIANKPRAAEILIALGDRHFEQFSDEEINVLFQHLRETNGGYDEGEWTLLQVYLRGFGVSITIFSEYLEGCSAPSLDQLSNLFHRLWTKNRAGHQKMDWRVFHRQLVLRGIYI